MKELKKIKAKLNAIDIRQTTAEYSNGYWVKANDNFYTNQMLDLIAPIYLLYICLRDSMKVES